MRGQRGRGICLDARRGGLRDDLGGNACALGRGQAGTLAALQDIEACLPFSLLGLDSDNGGEFLNYHVMKWLQQRPRPVFMTRSLEGRQRACGAEELDPHSALWLERHDNPEVVEPINVLVKGAYGQLLNYFHASLKLERKERTEGRLKRIYGAAQTPLARVLASPEVTPQTKLRLQQEKARLNPFAPEAAGRAKLENHCGSASGAPLKIVNNSPPRPPLGPRRSTAGGASWGSPAAPCSF